MIRASRVVPVGLLASYLRQMLDGDDLLADIWVEGEVTNLFPARSGHLYFTLRGDEGQLKCALFRPYAARQRSLPANGDQVAAHGRVGFYAREGAVQLYVDVVEPAGLGLAALELEQLRQRLAAEGLFDETRKRPLPMAPRVIGVVTSPDGSVWHDIQQVLRRRYPLTELILSPCQVQGDRAPAALVAAFEAIRHDGRAEVVILARGGGAAEDLAAFNDERVVRAVFSCAVPVVTGVGHETDWTLVDEVADLRAPTPSAAAELCVPSVADLAFRIVELRDRLARQTHDRVEDERLEVRQMRRRLAQESTGRTIVVRQAELRRLAGEGSRGARRRFGLARADLQRQTALLRALDPMSVLGRGYALLIDAESGAAGVTVAAARPGHRLRVEVVDGAIMTRIEEVVARQLPTRSARVGQEA